MGIHGMNGLFNSLHKMQLTQEIHLPMGSLDFHTLLVKAGEGLNQRLPGQRFSVLLFRGTQMQVTDAAVLAVAVVHGAHIIVQHHFFKTAAGIVA